MKQSTRSLVDLESSSGDSLRKRGSHRVSRSALWGELAASVAVDAASRGVELELDVDSRVPSDDPAKEMRVYRNLALAALRLTARAACLRIRVRDEQGLTIELESVCPGADDGRARLYRSTRSVPSEAGFALQAARAYVRPLGGTLDAFFMQDLGVRIELQIPEHTLG